MLPCHNRHRCNLPLTAELHYERGTYHGRYAALSGHIEPGFARQMDYRSRAPATPAVRYAVAPELSAPDATAPNLQANKLLSAVAERVLKVMREAHRKRCANSLP